MLGASTMASAWQKYVEFTLHKERTIIFNSEEESCIGQVKTELRKRGRPECWDHLKHEQQLNIVRGYWDRPQRVKDITDIVVEIYDWRKAEHVDDLLNTILPLHDEYHQCWPTHICGEDKYGHWVVMDRVEELEVSALSKYDEDLVLRYRAQALEALNAIKDEISSRLGYRVCQYVYIMDLKGLSIKKHFTAKVRGILQPIFKISGDYYPDSLWNLFIINAPMSFRMIWRIISPWIDPVVKAKIRILAGESAYIPAMIKSDIPIESIPSIIGGEGSTIMLKEVVERLVEEPDVKDHNFTCWHATPDPAVVEAHRKQLEELNRRHSLLSRISRVRNVRTFRKKTSIMTVNEDELDSEVAEEVYNEDEIILQGWLSKQGGVNTAWKRRYFVLTPSALYYFATVPTPECHIPRGKIELHMISEARLHSGDGLMELETPRRVYQLRLDPADVEVESDLSAATQRWVNEITSAAENDICAIDVEALSDDAHESHIIQAGFLFKRGAFNRSWRKRYFVLTSHALYYYTDAPTTVGSLLKGRIDLYRITATDVTSSKDTREFTVTMPGRVFYLRAETEDAADNWLSNISCAVEEELDNAIRRGHSDDSDEEEVPMLRAIDEEVEDTLGRTSSNMIAGLTSLASDFLAVAADMGILRKENDGSTPDEETMLQDVQKRVMHMFKLF